MRVKRAEIFFYLSYVVLFVSLFLGDVHSTPGMDRLSRTLRLFSYSLIVIQLVYTKFRTKELLRDAIIILLTLGYGICTRDLYWSILVVIILASQNIQKEKLMRISLKTMAICTLITLLLCLVGIIPNVSTIRDTSNFTGNNRYALGFYHSNVLPLIVLYLEMYYVFLKREKTKSLMIAFLLVVQIILYLVCNSRNAFYLSLLLSVLILIAKRFHVKKRILNCFYYLANYIVPIISAFSFSMMFLLLRGGIWDKIDFLFSGRFRLAIFKMRRIGLHFINFMNNEDFISDFITYVNGRTLDTVVIDNGYLYIILRYGILAIIFYIVVAHLLAKQSKNNVFVLIVLIILFLANFVDNDLVDYSFLPFILFAFQNKLYFGNIMD